jgi:hypothetical protein
MDFLFGNRRSTVFKQSPIPTNNNNNNNNRSNSVYTKKLPPTPNLQQQQQQQQQQQHQQQHINTNTNRASVTVQPIGLTKSKSIYDINNGITQQDNATVREPLKFLTPYVTEPKITGYSIDYFSQHFIEPFTAFSPRKYGEEHVDLVNIEQQMSQYESLIQNYGPQNFSANILSNLITLFGNSPNLKIQEQLLSIFRRVVPHKTSSLQLEYWSVMNIVYKNNDSYALKFLWEFCNLSQYFDPTVLNDNDEQINQEIDPDLLNLAFSVCLRMCEEYPDKVPACWTLVLKILYSYGQLVKPTQHWDYIIQLFSKTNSKLQLKFNSLVQMLFKDHNEFFYQKITSIHQQEEEQQQQQHGTTTKPIPTDLYLQLCVTIVRFGNNSGELIQQTIFHYIKNVLLTQMKQSKEAKDITVILKLPKTLSLLYELLTTCIRVYPSGTEQVFNYLKQLSDLDDDGWLLIETLENSQFIQDMNKNLVTAYEQCALSLYETHGDQVQCDHCIQMIETRDSLRSRLLASHIKK